MARWRLTGKHYLRVPGTEYEYNETTQDGKSGRHTFQVPLYLDPEDRSLQNSDGEVIVAHKGSEKRGDYIFVGPPTPEMEALDDEATAISASLVGEHPIESLPANFDAIPKFQPTPARRV